MDGALHIAVLGPLEARHGGAALALGGARQRVVLARLALSAGRPVPPSVLLEDLWGPDPPPNAMANLHSYVSRLRSVIGQDRLLWTAGGYRLEVRPEDVDLGQAERLVAEADALAGAEPEAAAALLSAALGLWRSEPLSDLPDTLPFAAELTRLHEWRLQLVERRCALLLDVAGRAQEVVPELARLVELEPTRERLQLLLMRGLHLTGRTAEALAAAHRYRRRLAEETGLDPSVELARLEQQLRVADPALAPAPGPVQREQPTPLPRRRQAPADLFVGRRSELGQLDRALHEHRLVTVTGPGGMGKTRLVLELLAARPRPSTFVSELVTVSDEGDVGPAVAASVGLHTAPTGVVDSVADRLGDDEALLVLDNCEHVLGAVRRLARELLARCPGLRVLATSRHRLDLPGEVVHRLGPLPEDDQVALFRDRAGLLRPDFAAPAADVLDVCRLLDGLPLALELAAHREAVFGLRQLAERLSAGLSVLEPATSGDRGTALTATAEWSYRLLEPQARTLFDRLAVCSGGFGPSALEHLAGPACDNPPALLAELVEASLVLVDLSVDPPRYRVLEPMRQVGAAHLQETARADARDAHARWMQRCADEIERLQAQRSRAAGVVLATELANLRGALTWLVETGQWERAATLAFPLVVALTDDVAVDLLGPLGLFARAPSSPADLAGACAAVRGAACWLAGQAPEAEAPLGVALALLPPDHPRRWVALFFRAMARMYGGDAAGVAEDTRALLADPATPEWVAGTSVCNAAMVHLFSGDRAAGEAWLLEHDALLSRVAAVDGFVACTRGEFAAADDPQAALACFDQAYRQCDAAGHTFNREIAAIGRAAVLLRLGRWAAAVPACARAIDTLRAAGMWPQLWTVLRLTAELLTRLDDPAPAAALLSAANADPFAPAVLGPDLERHDALWARITDELPAQRVQQARLVGAASGKAAAADLALEALRRHA